MNSSLLRSRAAFSLVEVTLALGVAAFCLVSIFGLLPIGVSTNQASFEQTGAANVASTVAADLRAYSSASSTAKTTTYYQIPVPIAPPTAASGFTTFYVRADGTRSGEVKQDANPTQAPHYRVTLYFNAAGAGPTSNPGNPNAVSTRMLITWPALADGKANSAPSKFSGSFESFVGLNANN